jgi:predicted PurR-regulated permease PerM
MRVMEKKKLNIFLILLLVVVTIVFYLVYYSSEKSQKLSELEQDIQHMQLNTNSANFLWGYFGYGESLYP